jgi:hypothetical protein
MASATPITTGVWSAVPDANGDGGTFWDGWSWDCDPTCNVGVILAGWTGLSGLEYLHNGAGNYVPFRFDDTVLTPVQVFEITVWTNGVLGRDANGAFTYDSGTGRTSNSWINPEQYALFRRVGPQSTQYFMGIEDMLYNEPNSDHDYNDYGVTFFTSNQPVPEPSTLLLLGAPLVGLAARRFRKRR